MRMLQFGILNDIHCSLPHRWTDICKSYGPYGKKHTQSLWSHVNAVWRECVWFITLFATWWQWRKHIACSFLHPFNRWHFLNLSFVIDPNCIRARDSLFARTMHLIRLFGKWHKRNDGNKKEKYERPSNRRIPPMHSFDLHFTSSVANKFRLHIDDLQVLGYVWHTNFG